MATSISIMRNTIAHSLFLALLTFASVSSLKSQSLFNKVYHMYGVPLSVYETPDSSFLLTGLSRWDDGVGIYENSFWMMIDKEATWQWYDEAFSDQHIPARIVDVVPYQQNKWLLATADKDLLLVVSDTSRNTLSVDTLLASEPQQLQGVEILLTRDNGFLVSASTAQFGASDFDIYLTKLDSSLDTLWTKLIDHSDEEYVFALDEFVNGDVLVAGSGLQGQGSGPMYVKLDSSGTELWTKTLSLNTSSYVRDACVFPDNKIGLLADNDLVLTDTAGDMDWNIQFDTSYVPKKLISESNGDMVVAGNFEVHEQNRDYFIRKVDASGQTLWEYVYGVSHLHDNLGDMIKTKDGGYLLVGNRMFRTMIFDLSTTWPHGTGAGDYRPYVVKTNGEGILPGIDETEQRYGEVKAYPNPVSKEVTIDLGDLRNSTARLYNAQGLLLQEQKNVTRRTMLIEIDGPSGLYLLEVLSEDQREVIKLIKQ